jgi:hypothetical protein
MPGDRAEHRARRVPAVPRQIAPPRRDRARLLDFAGLSFGQTSTGNTAGTASLFTYFGMTAVTFLLVLSFRATARRTGSAPPATTYLNTDSSNGGLTAGLRDRVSRSG